MTGVGMKFSSIAKKAGLTLVPASLALSLTGCGDSFDNEVSGATTPPAVTALALEFTPTSEPVAQPTPGPVTGPTPGPGPVVADPAGGDPAGGPVGGPIPIPETGWAGFLPPPGNLLRTPATCEGLRDFFEPRIQSQMFHTVITDTTIPSYSPIRLRTDSWISYIPEISNLYPGENMFVKMEPLPIDYSVCPPVMPARLEVFVVSQGLEYPLFYLIGSYELQPDRSFHPDYPYFFLKKKEDWRLIETFVGPFNVDIVYDMIDVFPTHSRR